MSPTVFRKGGFRFHFFSLEESRMHVHVTSAGGEAKFWLEPGIDLATSIGYKGRDLRRIRNLIVEHENEIRDAWRKHFGS